jgi:1-acyl-sn-glycerol-3-phosphate acyltransferase
MLLLRFDRHASVTIRPSPAEFNGRNSMTVEFNATVASMGLRNRLKRRATVALGRLGRYATNQALPAAIEGASQARRLADDGVVRLLGPDFEERLRQVDVRMSHGDSDPFGFDIETAKYALAAAAFFHRVYFRVQVFDIDRVPQGRVLLVANHSGQLPMDGMMIGSAMFFEAEPPRFIRSMVEKWTQTLPFVGTFFQRVGQVVGVPENARRLLEHGESVMVFPEGARGISKPWSERYELSDFGLGFMRLALETDTPIVPIAVVGAEEQYVNLGNSKRLAKLMHMPSFPIVPQWLIPGGQLPLPTKYRIYFGEPLYFDGDADDEDAVIAEKVGVVKRAVRSMLRRGLDERESVFW